MDEKLLILGASGFVGRHLFERLGPGRAIASYNKNPIPGAVRFDSTSMRLAEIIPDPSVVSQAVLLLGDSRPDSCVADIERSTLVNVKSIKAVIDQLSAWGIRSIFTSSGAVFDGEKGDYTETDPAEPILLYGRQKMEIERYLEATSEDYAVLRLDRVCGDRPGDKTLFTDWLEAIGRVASLRCAADQRFSPVYVGDAVDAILAAARLSLRGTFHVAGPEGLSRLECLEMLLSELNKHQPVELEVVPCSIDDFDLVEPRPKDCSMLPDKLVAAMGLSPCHPTEICRRLATAVSEAA